MLTCEGIKKKKSPRLYRKRERNNCLVRHNFLPLQKNRCTDQYDNIGGYGIQMFNIYNIYLNSIITDTVLLCSFLSDVFRE